MRKWTRRLALVVVTAAVASLAATAHASVRGDGDGGHRDETRTPIRHLVVIFQENVSFDHYFGTYPNAANTDGQPFVAAPGTPPSTGCSPRRSSIPALQHCRATPNPNAARRSARQQRRPASPAAPAAQLTCDQDHNYSDEQQSFDGGQMDQFVQSVGTGGGTTPFGTPVQPRRVMDYYDGNTITALWNYAQHYAMSDNSFGTTFGPSAPGAINLVSGDTGGVDTAHMAEHAVDRHLGGAERRHHARRHTAASR